MSEKKLSKMDKQDCHLFQIRRFGFAFLELVVVVGIIALVLAILLPVMFHARARAQTTTCLSNMEQLSTALIIYTQENDGLPPRSTSNAGTWMQKIYPSIAHKNVFHCPACSVPSIPGEDVAAHLLSYGYALNGNLYTHPFSSNQNERLPIAETAVVHPSTTVLLCEVAFRTESLAGKSAHVALLTNAPDEGDSLVNSASERVVGLPGAVRHQGGSNYAFVDGHAHWYKPQQISSFGAGVPNDGRQPSFSL